MLQWCKNVPLKKDNNAYIRVWEPSSKGRLPCFCDRVIIISIILFDWKYRGNHTSREKIKSCYWGDLKEAKVVRNHRGTFREQQAVGWGQVQGKGSGGGGKTEGSRAMLWPLNPTPRARGRRYVCEEEQPGPSWAFPSWLWGRKRVSESRSHAQSHTSVWTRAKSKNKRPALREEEPHFSAQLPGEKTSFKDLIKCPYYSLTIWFVPIEAA